MGLYKLYTKICDIKNFWAEEKPKSKLLKQAQKDIDFATSSCELLYEKLIIAIEALNLYKNRSCYSYKDVGKDILANDAELHAEVALKRIGEVE